MKYTLIEEIELGSKNAQMKLNIIKNFIRKGDNTISELGRDVDLRIPTITKLLGELIDEGYVIDFGKQESQGGRKPNVYGLNPDSGCFLGVDIKRFRIILAFINFKGQVIVPPKSFPFNYENTTESFEQLCKIINTFIDKSKVPRSKILSAGINISGRVNTETGHSYSMYFFNEQPLTEVFHEKLGLHCTIDNDSRSMAYGEFMEGVVHNEQNVLYINCSWGLGLGIIINGQLYYGKSGFSGEFGHMPVFDNDVLCHCGKRGCLETQTSGSYVYRKFLEKMSDGYATILNEKRTNNEPITQEDILNSALQEDMLAIELIEEVGFNLGRHIASLINLFNPELVVIGGVLAMTGDYLLLPLKSAIKKYSLNLVSNDTVVKLGSLGDNAGVIGACMLSRSKMLGIISVSQNYR